MQLAPINQGKDDCDSDEEGEGFFGREELAECAELEYFCQAAGAVASQNVKGSLAGKKGSALNALAKGGAVTAAVTNQDFIAMNPEDQKDEGEVNLGEIDRLREENKRLKKTLLDKFAGDEDL